MLTSSDLEHRNIILLHAFDGAYHLNVSLGNVQIKNNEGQVLTKLSRQSVLALFIIGHYTLTSALIDYCTKNAIALAVFNTHLRPVFFLSIGAEANFILRRNQHVISESLAFQFAQKIVHQKIYSHIMVLNHQRNKSLDLVNCIEKLEKFQRESLNCLNLEQLMGIEGNSAKIYFKHQFSSLNWHGRKPRLKIDPINVILDMGYTLLFNYIEVNLRLFGFDTYVGVLHQLWFKRKSLVCDLVEPFYNGLISL